MLACDSAHPFNSRKETFSRHFRTDSFIDPRDLKNCHKMFTEGEPTEKMRKLSASPPSNSPPVQHLEPSGQDQHDSSMQEPMTSIPSKTSSSPSSSSPKMSSSPKTLGEPIVVDSNQQQQHELPTRHLPHHTHQLCQQDTGNNSDSDSSGTPGATDLDMSHASHFERRHSETVPDAAKDEAYWEKRRKNNEAARKSREKRRMHDMVLEGRIANLEDDNGRLRRELLTLKTRFNLPEDKNFAEGVKEVKHHRNVSPPDLSNSNQPTQTSPKGPISSKPSNHILPHHNGPYGSPPPLLAVSGAMQMGMAVYPNPGSGLQYFLSEASRIKQESGGVPPNATPLPGSHHPIIPRHHPAYPIEHLKQEPVDEEVRVRERSNSNIERRVSYHIDLPDSPLLRRGSVGNYSQYCPPLSPPTSNHQSYPRSLVSPAGHPHYLQHTYDSGYPQSLCSQRSPMSSHSSDDNYDEPLQLTVRRDSNVSGHSQNALDDSSRESDQGQTGGEKSMPSSPPASSFPLKLRHKLPIHDMYPKEMFPSIATPSCASTPSSFPTHHFMNGLANLSDMAMNQSSPLSLIKKEHPSSFRQRKDASGRAGNRRNPNEPKYMDPKYLERRRRNNEAARKCRENRKTLTKIREVKSDYLETENDKLRDELNGLQEEMKQLRELIEKKRLEQGIRDDPHAES